jgi:hypothetical protein
MISSGSLAAIVAVTGVAAWAGVFVGHWWDLLTAWLIWGSVVLVALLCELARSRAERPRMAWPQGADVRH